MFYKKVTLLVFLFMLSNPAAAHACNGDTLNVIDFIPDRIVGLCGPAHARGPCRRAIRATEGADGSPLPGWEWDMAPYIQDALDTAYESRCANVYMDGGLYTINTPIYLPEHVILSGPAAVGSSSTAAPAARAELRAITVDSADDGFREPGSSGEDSAPPESWPTMIVFARDIGDHSSGDDVHEYFSGGRAHALRGIRLNANQLAVNGIKVSNTVFSSIEDASFVTFHSGSACIWGGGNIYLDIVSSFFSTYGMALHFQVRFRNAGTGPYYGINIGRIVGNVFEAREGNRLAGHSIDYSANSHDVTITGEAALVLHDDKATGGVHDIRNNYFELRNWEYKSSLGRCVKMSDRPLRGIMIGNQTVRIVGNELFGNACKEGRTEEDDSIAIASIGNNANPAVEITGNMFARWYSALSFLAAGDSGTRIVAGNRFNQQIQGPYMSGKFVSDNQRNAEPNTKRGSEIVQIPGVGVLFQNGAIHPSLIKSANDTPAIIDLSRGNAFQVHTDTTHDWNRIHAVRPGTFFTFNTIGPANEHMGGSIDAGVFGLSAGRDISLPGSAALHFTVDSNKQTVEVGDDSQTIGLQTRGNMDGIKLAAGESFDFNIELIGIQPGDVVTATPDEDLGKEVIWNSFVPANDRVTVRIINTSSSPVTVTPHRFSVAGRRIP